MNQTDILFMSNNSNLSLKNETFNSNSFDEIIFAHSKTQQISPFLWLTIVISCFLSTYAYADEKKGSSTQQVDYGAHATTDTNMSGFYLSASGGASHTNVKYHVTQDNVYASTLPYGVLDIKTDSGKTQGILSGIFGGGIQLQRFYLGLDLYAGSDLTKLTVFDNSDSGRTNGFWKTSVKHGFYYGLSPRVGYKVAPSALVYMGLNIEMGKWCATVVPDSNISQDVGQNYYGGSTFSLITQGMVDQSLVTKKISKRAVSLAPKFGIDLYISRNIFMRAEYSYLFGPKIKLNLYTAGNYSIASDNVTQTFKITQQRFMIAFGYKF